jgi:hypothetical protein
MIRSKAKPTMATTAAIIEAPAMLTVYSGIPYLLGSLAK